MLKKPEETLYFYDKQHSLNYKLCTNKFNSTSREYLSACYIAAFPGIFKCFHLELQINGPFDWYFEHLLQSNDNYEQVSYRTGNTAPLTSQTTSLLHLGLNLWNGHKFDLAEGLSIWDEDIYNVALQAISLRRAHKQLEGTKWKKSL
jgi:hypothetical protein